MCALFAPVYVFAHNSITKIYCILKLKYYLHVAVCETCKNLKAGDFSSKMGQLVNIVC